ncbi:hypothetical protein ABZ348_01935 [Streptomyces sp. NPDC005963]|uniref:hypothetical protein n=1 Tax=Streptomyces sp. NPDC005963 TaxID=3156721 RepID=UPI0033F503B7
MHRKGSLISITAALTAGLIAGYLLFPSTHSTPGSKPPKKHEKDHLATGEKPEFSVKLGMSDLGTEKGWVLMASEELARRDPPAAVRDCRSMHKWALAQGAVPTVSALHTLTLSANFATNIRITSIEMRKDHLPRSPDVSRAPVIRLSCLPRPGSKMFWHDPGDFSTVDTDGYSSHPSVINGHKVSQLKEAQQNVLVDLTGSTGPFRYSLTIGLETSIRHKKVIVSDDDGPLLGTEDGAAIGYWPAEYIWTMSPRNLLQCQEQRDVRPGQKPKCS